MMLMVIHQLNLEREKELHKDDVAQLQFEVEQMKQKAADLQMKLVRSSCCHVILTLCLTFTYFNYANICFFLFL